MGRLQGWALTRNGQGQIVEAGEAVTVCMDSIFECQIPLALLGAVEGSKLGIRFTLWRERLPLDALPREGFIEVHVLPESELSTQPYAKP
jgi:hypothetical protein